MQKTFPVIRYGNDYAKKEDATFAFESSPSVNSLSDANDFNDDIANFEKYITGEQDWWLLDGSMKIASEDAKVGYLSGNASSASASPAGQYAISSTGSLKFLLTAGDTITLLEKFVIDFGEYSETCPIQIKLSFYNAALSFISDATYTLASLSGEGVFENNKLTLYLSVSNVRQVNVTIANTNKINKPLRMLRILSVEMGDVKILKGESLRNAIITEEVSPISTELSINTFNFEMYTEDEDNFIYNDNTELKESQPLDAYVYNTGVSVYMGRFYVEESKSKSKNWITVSSFDAIGLLENSSNDYYGGYWSDFSGDYGANNIIEPAIEIADLLDDILDGTGIEYELDSFYIGQEVGGMLYRISPRAALQQLAFRMRATISCARSNKIKFYPYSAPADGTPEEFIFTASEKSLSSTLSLKKIISKVELVQYSWIAYPIDYYEEDGDVFQGKLLYNFDTIDGDTYTLIHPFLMAYFSPNGAIPPSYPMPIGAIIKNTPNAFIFTAEFTGFPFNDNLQLVAMEEWIESKNTIVYDESASYPGQKTGSILIDNCTLTEPMPIYGFFAPGLAGHVYDYYRQRYVQEMKLYGSNAYAGAMVLVHISPEKNLRGIIESNKINLSNGLISEIRITAGVLEEV
jgi:hypothetical protein